MMSDENVCMHHKRDSEDKFVVITVIQPHDSKYTQQNVICLFQKLGIKHPLWKREGDLIHHSPPYSMLRLHRLSRDRDVYELPLSSPSRQTYLTIYLRRVKFLQ